MIINVLIAAEVAYFFNNRATEFLKCEYVLKERNVFLKYQVNVYGSIPPSPYPLYLSSLPTLSTWKETARPISPPPYGNKRTVILAPFDPLL